MKKNLRKIAVLIDMSPAVVLFWNVGSFLRKSGFDVVWICESRVPVYKYGLNLEGEVAFYSDYKGEGLRVACSTGIMFSNYDRDYELGLLRKNKDYYSGRRIESLLGFFADIHQKFGFDAVLYENVSNGFSYAAYVASVELGYKFFGLIGSRLPGRFEIWESPFGLSQEIKVKLNEGVSSEGVAYAKLYLEGRNSPDYMKGNKTAYNYSYFKHYIKKVADLLTHIEMLHPKVVRESRRAFQSHHPWIDVLNRLARNLARRMRLKSIESLYESAVAGESYYLYPLHYHPESSTSVLSPSYVDELNVVKNIAFSLPLGTMLYVKDHPNAAAFKSRDFYRKLASLPNVRLLSYRDPVTDLIENSNGVITLTSTMGFEALLKGIPVYTLGRVFYDTHPMCFDVKGFDELYESLSRSFEVGSPDLSAFNVKFVAAYYDVTHVGRFSLDLKGSDCKSLVRNIGQSVAKRIGCEL